jgi:hypothetical protein
MNTAAQRAAAYLQERAAVTDQPIIASTGLYPKRETQLLRLDDLQELVATALDIEQHIRDIQAAAWYEGAMWMWNTQGPEPAPRDNPYRD